MDLLHKQSNGFSKNFRARLDLVLNSNYCFIRKWFL